LFSDESRRAYVSEGVALTRRFTLEEEVKVSPRTPCFWLQRELTVEFKMKDLDLIADSINGRGSKLGLS